MSPVRILAFSLGLLLVAGCGSGESLAALRAEPLLEPPPGTTELYMDERRNSQGFIFAVEVSGYVEVVYASAATIPEMVEHYEQAHGERYALEETGFFDPTGDVVRLVGGRENIKASVVVDSIPRLPGEEDSAVEPPPPGTNSVVTVRVSSP